MLEEKTAHKTSNLILAILNVIKPYAAYFSVKVTAAYNLDPKTRSSRQKGEKFISI